MLFAYFQDAVLNSSLVLALYVGWKMFWPLLGWLGEPQLLRPRQLRLKPPSREAIEAAEQSAYAEAHAEPDAAVREVKLARLDYERRLKTKAASEILDAWSRERSVNASRTRPAGGKPVSRRNARPSS